MMAVLIDESVAMALGAKEQTGIEYIIPFHTIREVCNNMFIEIKIINSQYASFVTKSI